MRSPVRTKPCFSTVKETRPVRLPPSLSTVRRRTEFVYVSSVVRRKKKRLVKGTVYPDTSSRRTGSVRHEVSPVVFLDLSILILRGELV